MENHDNARIESLLELGLDCFGRGDTDGAVAAWRSVLDVDPENDRALDYLESCGALPAPVRAADPHPQVRSRKAKTLGDEEGSVLDSPALLALVESGAYEDALRMLVEARALSPDDASISRSIQHLKARLTRRYARSLGDLDAIPSLSRVLDTTRDREVREVARLVDGIASFCDIIECSTLGRLPTLRALVALLDEGILHVAASPPLVSSGDPPEAARTSEAVEAVSDSTAVDYDELFRRATADYVRRDYASAKAGFERCLTLRPGDARVQFNLKKLERP